MFSKWGKGGIFQAPMPDLKPRICQLGANQKFSRSGRQNSKPVTTILTTTTIPGSGFL